MLTQLWEALDSSSVRFGLRTLSLELLLKQNVSARGQEAPTVKQEVPEASPTSLTRGHRHFPPFEAAFIR